MEVFCAERKGRTEAGVAHFSQRGAEIGGEQSLNHRRPSDARVSLMHALFRSITEQRSPSTPTTYDNNHPADSFGDNCGSVCRSCADDLLEGYDQHRLEQGVELDGGRADIRRGRNHRRRKLGHYFKVVESLLVFRGLLGTIDNKGLNGGLDWS